MLRSQSISWYLQKLLHIEGNRQFGCVLHQQLTKVVACCSNFMSFIKEYMVYLMSVIKIKLSIFNEYYLKYNEVYHYKRLKH